MTADKTLLQMKYARLITRFADAQHISRWEAMDFFYHSRTYDMMKNGTGDMHAMSDIYLTDELQLEYKGC